MIYVKGTAWSLVSKTPYPASAEEKVHPQGSSFKAKYFWSKHEAWDMLEIIYFDLEGSKCAGTRP
jgi:hypothetical protein